MNPEGTNSYCLSLVGEQLQSVEKRDFSWFFGFSGEVSLATETFWRLINEDRIVVTSEDHGHQFGLPEPVDAASVLSSIVGRSVEGAGIDASSGDLTIEFSGRVRLQLPYAAAMAMPRPRQWLATDAVGRQMNGSDDAA